MPSSEIISRHTTFWTNEVDRLESTVANLLNDIGTYNQVLEGLRSGELSWDRVQIMETGQLKVHPPPPPDTCIKEISEEFGKANGQKPDVTESMSQINLVEIDGD